MRERERSKAYKILVGESKRKRLLRKHRRRWKITDKII
jgi:hypothetical protein